MSKDNKNGSSPTTVYGTVAAPPIYAALTYNACDCWEPSYVPFSGATGSYATTTINGYSGNDNNYCLYLQNPQVNQIWNMVCPFIAQATGTYRFIFNGSCGVDRGIWRCDVTRYYPTPNVTSFNLDTYSPTFLYREFSGTVACNAGDAMTVQLICTGKNASSSDYYLTFESLTIVFDS